MSDALIPAIELNDHAWRAFTLAIAGLEEGEADWRPLPESNTIALVVRHLRIEAEWHVECLERGGSMLAPPSPERQREIDATPMDVARNLADLTRLMERFLDLLRASTTERLVAQTRTAYGEHARARPHILGYHQALHLTGHTSQIRMIRNLYQKTRGRAQPFFPENRSYPK